MRAMDYITSANICFLACDVLSFLDKRPVEHGYRVAYILMSLLSAKNDMDEYEIAEYTFLAMLHDIGVYKTAKLSQQSELTHDYGNHEVTNPHSVYGSIFLENVSPFGDRSEILLYHHVPLRKIHRLHNFKYEKVTMYLHLAEDVDAAFVKDGTDMDIHAFEPKAGQEYLAESVMLLMKCVRKNKMLQKLKDGSFMEELKTYMAENILFTNEEKEGYLRMIMHFYSLRERMRTMEAIICNCITDEIADAMDLITREKEKLGYAAILRDMGMLSVDINIINAPRKLTEEEYEEVKDHVNVVEATLDQYFDVKDISDIASGHHEVLDGTGYPHRLHDSQMTKSMQILQVADVATALMSPRKYRKEYSRSEIMNILLKQSVRRRLNDEAVKALGDRYDAIEKRIQSETRNYLEMHQKINNTYKFLVEHNLGQEM